MTEEAHHTALAALRRFTSPKAMAERCDLCSALLSEPHEHLLELHERRVRCACRACTMLFPETGQAAYRRIVSRATHLPSVRLGAEDFEALGIPVRLVFLCQSRVHDCLFAVYPNAAGAAEGTLPAAAWGALVDAHPALSSIEPDVEGLFLNALGEESDAYRLSIDVWHRIVGVLRVRSGRKGGVQSEIQAIFRDVTKGVHV